MKNTIKKLKVDDLINLKLNPDKKTKILFIYPHPDDETMTSGSLMSRLVDDQRFEVYAVSVTHGEHGDEKYKLPPYELAEVRKSEFKQAMETLGVKRLDLWNFIDGNMSGQEKEIKAKVTEFITKNEIDVVVTFERLGLYGHPDHILLSKVVNEISLELKERNIKVLYSTLPDSIIKRLNLPKTLTYKDRVVQLNPENISDPEFKINGFRYILKKYMAARKYKSQNLTGGKMPLLFAILRIPYEYYTTKYE